jgi:hypothetical protein
VKARATLLDDDFTRLAKLLARATGKTMRESIVDEAGLVADHMQRLTAPEGKGRKAKQIGERAVERDILRSMTPFPVDRFRSEDMRKLAREGNVQAIHDRIATWNSKFKNWTFHNFTPALHTSSRSSRHRVRRKHRRYVLVPDEDWLARNYIKPTQARVGSLKAGWNPAIRKLGRKSAGWIRKASRGRGERGDADISSPGAKNHTVEIYNAVPTITRHQRDAKTVLKFRARAMTRRLASILRKQGAKAVL